MGGGGFPFKLLVTFRDRKIVIRTVEEARIFVELLDKEFRVGQTAAQERDTAKVTIDTQDEAVSIEQRPPENSADKKDKTKE